MFISHGCNHGTYIRWLLRTCRARMKENRSCLIFFFSFVTVFDLHKCLEQIKQTRSLHTCAPISELTANIVIMVIMQPVHMTNQIIYTANIHSFNITSTYFIKMLALYNIILNMKK